MQSSKTQLTVELSFICVVCDIPLLLLVIAFTTTTAIVYVYCDRRDAAMTASNIATECQSECSWTQLKGMNRYEQQKDVDTNRSNKRPTERRIMYDQWFDTYRLVWMRITLLHHQDYCSLILLCNFDLLFKSKQSTRHKCCTLMEKLDEITCVLLNDLIKVQFHYINIIFLSKCIVLSSCNYWRLLVWSLFVQQTTLIYWHKNSLN
jgi:hypothetical protein